MADTGTVAVFAGVIVSLGSAASAFASQRAASKASVVNTRTVAEEEAYSRARKMDVETIKRQDDEIAELRDENKNLQTQIRDLSERLSKCERSLKDCAP